MPWTNPGWQSKTACPQPTTCQSQGLRTQDAPPDDGHNETNVAVQVGWLPIPVQLELAPCGWKFCTICGQLLLAKNWRATLHFGILHTPCSQWRVGKTDSSHWNFELHIGSDAHLEDGRLDPFPGISWRIGSRILPVHLTGNVALHQLLGWHFYNFCMFILSTVITDGMLQVKFPRGFPLRDFMYSSAEPTLVCRVLSPRVFYRIVVSDSDARKWKWWTSFCSKCLEQCLCWERHGRGVTNPEEKSGKQIAQLTTVPQSPQHSLSFMFANAVVDSENVQLFSVSSAAAKASHRTMFAI